MGGELRKGNEDKHHQNYPAFGCTDWMDVFSLFLDLVLASLRPLSSRILTISWIALRDDTKKGCVADYDGKEMYKKSVIHVWYTWRVVVLLILPSPPSFLKVPDRTMITGYIPRVHLNLILAYLFREEVNKDEPGLFYWIYMFFFWSQCISTVVLAVLIAAKRNEDGPIFVVKVRPA